MTDAENTVAQLAVKTIADGETASERSPLASRTGSRRRLLVVLAGAYTVLLTAVSLLPSGDRLEGPLAGWDAFLAGAIQNALHIPAYAGLVWLWLAAVPPGRSTARGHPWAIIVGCCLYGVLLEGLQTLVPGRTLSGGDMAANAVGAVLGALGWWALQKRAR